MSTTGGVTTGGTTTGGVKEIFSDDFFKTQISFFPALAQRYFLPAIRVACPTLLQVAPALTAANPLVLGRNEINSDAITTAVIRLSI